ncbi:MAG: hypothetical protein ACREOO_20745 [bacterium]
MNVIAFQTKIKNGAIEVPAQYRKQLGTHVKVIVFPVRGKKNRNDLIEQLLESPVEVEGFAPFKREEMYERGDREH